MKGRSLYFLLEHKPRGYVVRGTNTPLLDILQKNKEQEIFGLRPL